MVGNVAPLKVAVAGGNTEWATETAGRPVWSPMDVNKWGGGNAPRPAKGGGQCGGEGGQQVSGESQ